MPKNGKSKEKNNIVPKVTNAVNYYDDHTVGNADEQLGSIIVGYEKTNGSTTNLPEGGIDNGILFGIRKQRDGNDGYQLYFQDQGNLWFRRKKNGDNRWKLLTQNMSEYMKKPENETPITNANLKSTKSGIYSTTDSTTGLPSELRTGTDKWGILQHFKEGTSGNTGFQMFTPIDGVGFGKIYFRVFKDSSSSITQQWKKLDIHQILDMGNNIFLHPSTTPPSNRVDKTTPNGYYKTNSSTQGLPQGKAGDGFVKVVKHGTHGIVTYTHIADNKVYTATYDTTTRNLSNNLDWDKVGATDGHTKVHDTRDERGKPPSEYKKHTSKYGGYVVYEWKWATSLDLQNLVPGHSNKDILLKTIIPEPKDIEGSDIISQIAYVIVDHKYYWRKAIDRPGTRWTDWEEVGGKDSLKMDRPENVNVIYRADDVDHSGVFKTSNSNPSTENLPSQQDNKDGVLTHYIINSNNAIQYWISSVGTTKGTLYLRYKENGTWRNWQPLGTGGSTPSGVTIEEVTQKIKEKAILRPESDASLKFTDINSISLPVSGIYHTPVGSRNTPNNYGANSKGMLEVFFNNSSNGNAQSGLQRWTCTTGDQKGRSWIRVNDDSGWSNNWKEITATGSGITLEQVRQEFNTLFNNKMNDIISRFKQELKIIFEHFHK